MAFMYSESGMAIASASVKVAGVLVFQLLASLASFFTAIGGGGTNTGDDMVKLVLAAVDTSIGLGAMLLGLIKPALPDLGLTMGSGGAVAMAALFSMGTAGGRATLAGTTTGALGGTALAAALAGVLAGATLTAGFAAAFSGALATTLTGGLGTGLGVDLAGNLATGLAGVFTTVLAATLAGGLAAVLAIGLAARFLTGVFNGALALDLAAG